MDLLIPASALLGVAVGAIGSYLIERIRWKRTQSIRWDDRRLSAYLDYLSTAKAIALLSGRVMAKRGIEPRMKAIDIDVGLERLEELELERSGRFEGILLLADTPTIASAHALNRTLWHLEAAASALTEMDRHAWEDAYRDYRNVRSAFYGHARRSMGVPPADTQLPDWRVGQDPESTGRLIEHS